jgi:hypothetical protein
VAREGRSAYRVVVQVGGAAAAVASIAGLVLSFAHLLSSGAKPLVPSRITVAKPEVHATTFGDYLKEHGRRQPKSIPAAALAANVIAVDYRATIDHGPRKTSYPLRVTLLKSDGGVFRTVQQKNGQRLDTGIDPGTDRTVSDAFFDRLQGPGSYRVRVDVVSATDPENVLDSRSLDFTYP